MASQNPRKTKILILLALLSSSYFFFFLNLGSYSLKEPDEGRYAEIPREMVEQGEYVVPHLNYVRYFEKPPLLYWVTAASYRLFGVNEWSARLPNALAALFCVLVTYVFAARSFDRRMALISSLILTSSFGFFAMARVVTTDMLFAFLLCASLLSFCQFYRGGRRRFLFLFYAALASSVLAKGPVAVVLLGATIVLFLLVERRLSFLKEMASTKGILLFAVIALPWFVVMCVREREFFDFFFIDQHVLRFLTSKHGRSGPVYYFLPVLFGSLFPWSVFIPRAVVRLWNVAPLRLFFVWSLVVFAFFSVSGSKLPPYILPIYPALALILGYLFDEAWQHRIQRNRELIIYALIFACLMLVGLAYGSGLLTNYLAALPDVTAMAASVRGFSLGVGVASLAMLVLLSFSRGRTFSALFYSLGSFSLFVILGLMAHVQFIDGLNTTKGMAQEIKKNAKGNVVVVNYGSFDETLPFYLSHRTHIAEFTGELEMGAEYADAKPFFLNRDDFATLFRSEKAVFVVVKTKHLPRLVGLGLINEKDILGRQDERLLMANRAALGR